MVDNTKHLGTVFNFQREMEPSNPKLANSISAQILYLCAYGRPLEGISEDALIKEVGVRKDMAPYLHRLFNGESVESLVESIGGSRKTQESYDPKVGFDGSWDNAVGRYEG